MMSTSAPDQETIDRFVIFCHGNMAGVKEMLEADPALINARSTLNESPLGAAAHVGNRTMAEYLLSEGAELEFRPEALTAVARKALKRKTGARGLRTILEQVLLDTMYELPSLEHVSKVVVDEAVINGQAEPYLIYRGNLQSRAVAK